MPPAGFAVATVRRVLNLPAEVTLPGRSVLALAAHEQAQTARLAGLKPTRIAGARRAAYAVLRARRLAAQLLGRELAHAPWTGRPDGSAVVVVDGLVVRFAHGELALLVDCPQGAPEHTAAVRSLIDLGELVRLACVDPPGWPWACSGLCQPPRPAAPEAAAAGRRFVIGATVPSGDEVMTITWTAGEFARARELLATQLQDYVRATFNAGQLALAQQAADAADLLPAQPPPAGVWAITTPAGCRFWLCQHHPGHRDGLAVCACTPTPAAVSEAVR